MIMIINLLLSLLLFTSILCEDNRCLCDVVTVGTDEISQVLQMTNWIIGDCEKLTCVVNVLPHPEKDIRFEIRNVNIGSARLNISQYTIYKNETISQLVQSSTGTSVKHRNIQSCFNTGMTLSIEMYEDLGDDEDGFRINSYRVDNSPTSCGPSFTVISEKKKIFEEIGTSWTPCFYKLRVNDKLARGNVLFTFEYMAQCIVSFYDKDLNITKQISGDSAAIMFPASTDFQMSIEKNIDGYLYERPTMSVQYIGEKCSCDKEIKVPTDGLISLEPPGYPDVNCPSLLCETRIKAADPRINDTPGVLMFSIDDKLTNGDGITLSRKDRIFYSSKGYSGKVNYVTTNEDSIVSYHSGDNTNRRYYEVKVEHITIANECHCIGYKEKLWTTDGNFSMKIPSNCDFVYCSLEFALARNAADDAGGSMTNIKIHARNANVHDKAEIVTGYSRKIYKKDELEYGRSYSALTGSPQILFTRDARDTKVEESTELFIQWQYENVLNCQNDTKVYQLTTTPFVLVTGPMVNIYRDDEECRYVFDAPEDHDIHVLVDIHFGSDHDSIHLYEGNTTDTVFKSFTGSYTKQFVLEKNQMVFEHHHKAFVFNPDGNNNSDGKQGNFYISLVAVKRNATTTQAAITENVDSVITTLLENDPNPGNLTADTYVNATLI